MGQNNIDLKGRVAIVTGGAQGLGFAIAERLAQSGADVCIWDINQDAIDDAVNKLPGDPAGVVCNVADEESVADAVTETKDKLDKIDARLDVIETTLESVNLPALKQKVLTLEKRIGQLEAKAK